MIVFKHTGSLSKTDKFLKNAKKAIKLENLDKYGTEGVNLLSGSTPRDTGKTASSWSYEIKRSGDRVSIVFNNSNIQNGVPIAIILQYGHATRNGGWVEGIDYINPTLRPLFNKIADNAWKEVIKS